MLKKVTPIFFACGLFLLFGMGGASEETYRKLELFGEVLERVKTLYVEEKSDKELIDAALDGMLSSLDPHSGYLNEKDFEEMQSSTEGKFGGLGIEVTSEKGIVRVVSPIDETPAFKAGVKAGDYIIAIDGKNIVGLKLSEAVSKMRGEPGTKIEITVRREKPKVEILKFDITRAYIKIDSVKWRVEKNTGYIRIRTFNDLTTTQLQEAVKKIKRKLGTKLKGIVLDLRNNPGGLLDQAVSVSNAFLNKGEIVSTRGRDKKEGKKFRASSKTLVDPKLPMIVLINSGSASASEIVAGALKDHKRAIIMGTRSFGKGSVQTIMPLGANVGMRITTARYYTPSGKSIQGKGITPNIVVEQAKIETIEDIGAHEDDLRGALSSGEEESDKQVGIEVDKKKDKDAEEDLDPTEKLYKQDFQYQRAIDLIEAIGLINKKAA